MLIVRDIKLPIDTDFICLQSAIERKLNIKVQSVKLYKKANVKVSANLIEEKISSL